jgi:hypothetical protein
MRIPCKPDAGNGALIEALLAGFFVRGSGEGRLKITNVLELGFLALFRSV